LQAGTDCGQIPQPLVHLLNLAGNHLANVGAGAAALTPDGDDPLDFTKCEAQAPRLPQERQHSQGIGRVQPVARWRPARWLENPRRLINPERLTASTTATRNLADEQSVAFHGQSLNLDPRGQVKRYPLGARPPRLRPQEEAPGGDDALLAG
jgi:hypothetical protein